LSSRWPHASDISLEASTKESTHDPITSESSSRRGFDLCNPAAAFDELQLSIIESLFRLHSSIPLEETAILLPRQTF
jgi:hypothetical protein